MSGLYFYTAVLAFLAGVLIHSFFIVSLLVSVWLLVVALGITLYWRRYTQSELSKVMIIGVLILIATTFGLLRFGYSTFLYNASPLLFVVGQAIAIEGVVIREPDIREKTAHLILSVGEDRVLLFADRYIDVAYGDYVAVTGVLAQPESFTSDLGREFNYPGYLRARGIAYVMNFPDIYILETGQGNKILSFLYSVKHSFVSAFTSVVPAPASGLGVGVLLGIKQALGEDLEIAFRQTGIIHIVVLSGYNVMIVVAAVMYLLATFLSLRARVVVGIVAIVIFALLVGLSATVVRASCMAILVLLAQAFGRQYDIMRALFLAAVVMVCYQPYILAFDIGFQLSFMATLGLIIVAPYFENLLAITPARLGIRQFLVATIATQIAVAPLLLFHIGEISLIAVIVNVLVLPIVPFAMLATAITGVVAIVFPTLGAPFALVTYGILMSIIIIAQFFATVPFASVSVPQFPWYGIPLMYAAIAVVGYRYWYKKDVDNEIMPQPESVTEIRDWIIEDESSVVAIVADIQKGREHSAHPNVSVPPPETPIFFR